MTNNKVADKRRVSIGNCVIYGLGRRVGRRKVWGAFQGCINLGKGQVISMVFGRVITRKGLIGLLMVTLSAIWPFGLAKGGMTMEIKITSNVFENGGKIPVKYTCDGEDISPPLRWRGVPNGTKSFALICDDPDAPMGTWVHWVLFNVPAEVTELPENVPSQPTLANGAVHGINDFRNYGYGGPCPPSGTHRYFFKIYALDAKLGLKAGVTKAQLLDAMEGHVLAKGELMGKYSR